MAIDMIHEVFPGAAVAWERTARAATPTMTVDETTSGDEIATFVQRDMSDDYRGPGVDALRAKLVEYQKANSS
jgi:hypothetical protein